MCLAKPLRFSGYLLSTSANHLLKAVLWGFAGGGFTDFARCFSVPAAA